MLCILSNAQVVHSEDVFSQASFACLICHGPEHALMSWVTSSGQAPQPLGLLEAEVSGVRMSGAWQKTSSSLLLAHSAASPYVTRAEVIWVADIFGDVRLQSGTHGTWSRRCGQLAPCLSPCG